MKRLLSSLVAIMMLALVLPFSGCEADPCKDVTCNEPNGFCLDGTCICEPGYEGATCTTLSATKFAGTYSMLEPGCYPDPYNVTITASSDVAKILMSNFGLFECPSGDPVLVTASIVGNEFTLDSGPFCAEQGFSGYTFSGSGSIDTSVTPNVISVTYTTTFVFNGNTETYNCTATLTKQ